MVTATKAKATKAKATKAKATKAKATKAKATKAKATKAKATKAKATKATTAKATKATTAKATKVKATKVKATKAKATTAKATTAKATTAKATTAKATVAKDYTTLLDLLILDKDCSVFTQKLAEARLTSVLSNKGLDRQNRRVVRYTVFVPKKGLSNLKGEALVKALKTHIVKGHFSHEYVTKICEEKKLEALKMKTMAQYIIEVDCKNYKVKTLKGSSVSIKKKANLEASNGIVYFIDEPLQIEEKKNEA